jgi:hypothetical protein
MYNVFFKTEVAMTYQFPMQIGGILLVWRNPADTFRKPFLALDPTCNPDPHPGVVIIAEGPAAPGVARQVQNLRLELPALLLQHPPTAVAFWSNQSDTGKKEKLLSDLTASPVYADHWHFFPSRP